MVLRYTHICKVGWLTTYLEIETWHLSHQTSSFFLLLSLLCCSTAMLAHYARSAAASCYASYAVLALCRQDEEGRSEEYNDHNSPLVTPSLYTLKCMWRTKYDERLRTIFHSCLVFFCSARWVAHVLFCVFSSHYRPRYLRMQLLLKSTKRWRSLCPTRASFSFIQ